MSASFQITGLFPDELHELMLGPWRPARTAPAPLSGPEGLSFAAELESTPGGAGDGPCWCVDVVGSEADAHAALTAGARSVARAKERVATLPGAFDAALREPAGVIPDELVEFSAGPEPDGPRDASWQRILELALTYARVETRVRGTLHAHTVMDISGDTRVVVASGLPLDIARLHHRTVALVVQSRDVWLRLAMAVIEGSTRIAAAASMGPVGAVAALPAAWRLAGRVMGDLRTLRELDAASELTPRPRP
ncbi:hypothetical protein [Haliangium sp.]|uniref:hypothetical protein n=1 Tax=Haliangium sp. TaxID=2663208 RepID=UPI003D1432CA